MGSRQRPAGAIPLGRSSTRRRVRGTDPFPALRRGCVYDWPVRQLFGRAGDVVIGTPDRHAAAPWRSGCWRSVRAAVLAPCAGGASAEGGSAVIKRVSLVRRKVGMWREEFLAHWMGPHAAIVRAVPGRPRTSLRRRHPMVARGRLRGTASARCGSTASRPPTPRSPRSPITASWSPTAGPSSARRNRASSKSTRSSRHPRRWWRRLRCGGCARHGPSGDQRGGRH